MDDRLIILTHPKPQCICYFVICQKCYFWNHYMKQPSCRVYVEQFIVGKWRKQCGCTTKDTTLSPVKLEFYSCMYHLPSRLITIHKWMVIHSCGFIRIVMTHEIWEFRDLFLFKSGNILHVNYTGSNAFLEIYNIPLNERY